MPTEEFLARLVKSKASGASVVVVVAPEERGPEADSKAVPVAEPDDASDPMHIAVLLKDKDKKRHREGHSSRSHHSKKLKDSVSRKTSVAASVGQDGPSFVARDASSVGGSVDSLKTGLYRCKAYAEKVATDLGKLLTLGEVADAAEVIKLREEIRFLRYENLDLEKKSDALTKDNNASADRVFSLLTEKSELITECGSLSVKVADLENEVRGLEAALSASKDGLVEKKS